MGLDAESNLRYFDGKEVKSWIEESDHPQAFEELWSYLCVQMQRGAVNIITPVGQAVSGDTDVAAMSLSSSNKEAGMELNSQFCFSHLTFQEYLCAQHLSARIHAAMAQPDRRQQLVMMQHIWPQLQLQGSEF